jgi:hypothetical protein
MFAAIYCLQISAQQIELLTDNNKISIRGLSAVNDQIIWVSGTDGTVGKSTDGGKTWRWITVKNFEKKDFRDIEAFDERNAIIMAIGEPAFILKTTDGGETWTTVFADSTKGMFLDAMDFSDDRHGVVIGDPINNEVFLAHTENQGADWKIDRDFAKLSPGEALFASSGTNIKMLWSKEDDIADLFFVTGGKKSRLFAGHFPNDLNISQGKETQGANSISINEKTGDAIIVGGDFSKDTVSKNNCILFSLNNKGFTSPVTAPHGYRSCVEYITQNKVICCGTSGVDVSEDRGKNWRLISSSGFHVCRKAKTGETVFLAGINGKIARLKW